MKFNTIIHQLNTNKKAEVLIETFQRNPEVEDYINTGVKEGWLFAEPGEEGYLNVCKNEHFVDPAEEEDK